MYSKSITNLINSLKKLPSVGERTAERFVFFLLKRGKKDVDEIRRSLEDLLKNTKSCKMCWNFSDSDPCPFCLDNERNKKTICVVSDPQDIPAIEKTNEYKGLYFVLRGLIETSDENSLKKTKARELVLRAKNEKQIEEIILALNPDLPGETTAMFLETQIKKVNPDIKITRLARGLPMGSDLQYADEITLGQALKNRQEK